MPTARRPYAGQNLPNSIVCVNKTRMRVICTPNMNIRVGGWVGVVGTGTSGPFPSHGNFQSRLFPSPDDEGGTGFEPAGRRGAAFGRLNPSPAPIRGRVGDTEPAGGFNHLSGHSPYSAASIRVPPQSALSPASGPAASSWWPAQRGASCTGLAARGLLNWASSLVQPAGRLIRVVSCEPADLPASGESCPNPSRRRRAGRRCQEGQVPGDEAAA